MRILIVLFSILFTLPTFAHWQLDNETSVLSFITTKKLDIAEVHRFNQLSGEITQQGDVSLAIDLSSVNSSIAIRDERIKEFLFETAVFPKATFTTQINQSDIADFCTSAVPCTFCTMADFCTLFMYFCWEENEDLWDRRRAVAIG